MELWPGTWICTPILSQFNASWDSSQTSNQPNSAKMRREWSGVGNGVRAHNLRASSWRHRRYKLFILNSKRFYRSQKKQEKDPNRKIHRSNAEQGIPGGLDPSLTVSQLLHIILLLPKYLIFLHSRVCWVLVVNIPYISIYWFFIPVAKVYPTQKKKKTPCLLKPINVALKFLWFKTM